ncbi:MAG: tetratricopeptide repeat protein [Candidatus Omnitrophica bacterium]|nr:tetratricopeptide repeat protein [Candidatus Omnitrophota bacterium]
MKTKKIRANNIFILFAMFFLSFLKIGLAFNTEQTSAFNRANVYYEQVNYDEAIKEYESILGAGWESGNLYYNLGNCYFKKGQLGMAIFYYEKSKRLIPLDRDLESNYAYACSLIKGQNVSLQRGFLSRVLNNLFGKFTLDGLTVLLSALYILILIAILTGFMFRPFKKQALIIAAAIGVFFIAGFTGLTEKIAILNKEGVVVVAQADARFEPMDKATVYFTLSEGAKVEIISSKDNWYKIKRQDNKIGWIQKSALSIF